MFIKRIVQLLSLVLVFALSATAQVTTSALSGIVRTNKGEPLVGATVNATHVPTGTVYRVQTLRGGRFSIPNMAPGGPYTITVSFVGFADQKRQDIYLDLGESVSQEYTLADKATELSEVVVAGTRKTGLSGKSGAETLIGKDKVANLPSVGRNLSDLVRFTPQVKITSTGGLALGGQNNRFNSFMIDGAVNNDVFGLSDQGTNGGRAGAPPISLDAIDQISVQVSPYDVSQGNFTGGGINAITRAGSNTTTGSLYYFFRNQDLTGRSPVDVLKPGTQNVYERPKLTDFENKTFGFRIGGPIVKNKLFYFLNLERQNDTRPQPFDPTTYRGNYVRNDSVNTLINFLKNTYNYDPGGYVDNPDEILANRLASRFDWNINDRNQLTVAYRYTYLERTNPPRSSVSRINFNNSGEFFPSTTHSGSAELNSKISNKSSNKLRVTYTNVLDDRNPVGSPFPNFFIRDGGTANGINFGSEAASSANLLKQDVLNIFDAFKVVAGKSTFTLGTDIDINKTYNLFINRNFGFYEYGSIGAFMANTSPLRYRRGYSLVDPETVGGDQSVNSAAEFRTSRVGFFVSDDIRPTANLTLTVGLRADITEFHDRPATDRFFRDTGYAIVSQFYDLKGARVGGLFDPKWMLSPRFGFRYNLPDDNITLRGGIGLYAGRIPLVWPGGGFQNTGVTIGAIDIRRSVSGVDQPILFPNGSPVPFVPSVNGQYDAADFGINPVTPQGELNLVSRDFKMPQVLKTSLAVDKRFGKGWTLSVEGLFTKNLIEADWQNVLFNPSIRVPITGTGRDTRTVFDPAFGGTNAFIPMRPSATGNARHPYTSIILVKNTEGRKGYSYNFTVTLDKAFRNGWAFNMNYVYGDSWVRNEGTSSINSSNWTNMESINGKNNLDLTRSDFSLGHRITAYLSKKFVYANKRMATTVTLDYNGQSGNPISWVLSSQSIGNDGDNFAHMMYVPTTAELSTMTFLSNTVNGVAYTPDQQRAALNAFIGENKFLNRSRGKYAERNGDRLPFTHVINLGLKQDFNLLIGKKTYTFQITYDVFNFTNMLNKDWGRQYFASFDQVSVLQFAGFAAGTRTPQYRFTPQQGTPYTVSDGISPFNSSRWTSQLGLRFNF